MAADIAEAFRAKYKNAHIATPVALIRSDEPTSMTATFEGKVTHLIGKDFHGTFVLGKFLRDDGTWGGGTYDLPTFKMALERALALRSGNEIEIILL